MRIGYARVSTTRQAEHGTSLEDQRRTLEDAGCERIYADGGVSGATTDRPQLRALMDAVRDGDDVCITRLDRLGRSTADLLTIVQDWTQRGISLHVLDQGIDVSGPTGQLMLTLMGALAEYERSLILERTAAGRAAAHAAGRHWGGSVRSWSDRDARHAAELDARGLTHSDAARAMGTSRRTLLRMLDRAAELEGDTGATTEGVAA